MVVAAVGWLGGLGVGCTSQVEASDGDAGGEVGAVHGYLGVERTVDEQGVVTLRDRASATFVRTREGTDPRLVARLLGVLPSLPPPGQCAVSGADEVTSPALRMLSPAELLPVGDVALRVGDDERPLLARAYPDVAHLLSGVVYTTSDAIGSGAAAVADGDEEVGGAGANTATFMVGGSAAVAPFEVTIELPPAPSAITVNGRPLGEHVDEAEGVERARGEALAGGDPMSRVRVGWSGEGASGDVVFVDAVLHGTRGVAARQRCVPAVGEQHVVVDAPGDLVVAVHRLRTVRVEAGRGPSTEVRVDTAVWGRAGFPHEG